MNLVCYVIKSCETQRVSRKILFCANQVHIPVKVLTLLFIIYIRERNSSKLLKLQCIMHDFNVYNDETVKQLTRGVIIVTSLYWMFLIFLRVKYR